MRKPIVLLSTCLIALLLAAAPAFCRDEGSDSRAEGSEKAAKKDRRAVKLTWNAPETNTDGSALKDLAGYRIYYRLPSQDYNKERSLRLDLESKGLRCVKDGTDKQGRHGKDKKGGKDDKAPTVCTYTLHDLGKAPHFFTVRAFNERGKESNPSNEVKK